MGSSTQLLVRINGDSGPFAKAIGEVNSALDRAFQKANASSRGFQQLGSTLSSIGSTLSLSVTSPMLALGAASVKAAVDIDNLKRGLTTVTGSAAATEVEFRKLRETAKLPGIDFQQAVRGSIRLQTLGVSADKAREIMGNLGNALAAAGGTKADFGEVIRQLSQLSATGKVTKENLDPITDRLPIVAAIIKDKFGAEALGDPAKVLGKLGIDSQKFVEILNTELAIRVPKITGSAQTAFDSFSEAVNETAGRIGEKFLPSITNALPEVEKFVGFIGDAVDEFTKLPQPIRDTTIAITALIVAAGPISAITGSLIAFGGAIRGVAAAASLLTPQTAALAGALAYTASIAPRIVQRFNDLRDSLDPLNDKSDDFTRTLLGRFPQIENSLKALVSTAGGLNGVPSTFQILSDTTGKWRSKIKEISESAPKDFGKVKQAVDALSEAYNTLGVANTTDAIGGFVKAREALAVVQRAYENKKASTVDLQRATEALGQAYLKLIDGLGGIRPKAEEVGIAFDFARERALMAIGDIQAAAAGARNISLGQLIIPPETGPTALDGSDAARSSKRNLELIKITAQGAQQAWGTTRTAISRQVSTITTDFSRAVADIVTGASSAGEAFKRLGQSVAQSLVRTIVENGVNVAIKALGNLLSSLGGVGKAVGGIFGSAGGAVGGAAGSAGGLGGSLGSAVAAANPVTAIVGAVSGVVTAISSVISNFQFAAMNKTLDLIEKEARFTQIHALYILEKLNQFLPELANIHQRLIEIRSTGVKIEGGSAATVNITVQGSLIGGPNVAAELSAMVVRNLKLQGI
jgi:tape measure domain-containing protein